MGAAAGHADRQLVGQSGVSHLDLLSFLLLQSVPRGRATQPVVDRGKPSMRGDVLFAARF
jgi:hypothetical protein